VMSGHNLAHDAEADTQSARFRTGKEIKKPDNHLAGFSSRP